MSGRVAAVLGLGALLVVGLLVAGVLLLRPQPAPPRVQSAPVASLAPGADTAQELALASCVQLRLAAQGIRAGSEADRVRRQLAGARALAAEAFRRDAVFAPLSGGIAALDEAVRRDDPGAASAGLQAALAACTRLAA